MFKLEHTTDLRKLLDFEQFSSDLQGIVVVINSRTGEKITINHRKGRLASKLPRKLKKRITRNRCAHLDWREYCQFQYRTRLDHLFQPLVQRIQESHDADCLQHMLADAEAARAC